MSPDDDPITPVLDVLRLRPGAAPDTFTGDSIQVPTGRVFGGQVLAQALLAAGRTVDPDRLPHSMHGYFLRAGDVAQPITFDVERLHDGRSFSARRVHARQDDGPILTMAASFQADQPGIEFADARCARRSYSRSVDFGPGKSLSGLLGQRRYSVRRRSRRSTLRVWVAPSYVASTT